jgi:hypothetical protein
LRIIVLQVAPSHVSPRSGPPRIVVTNAPSAPADEGPDFRIRLATVMTMLPCSIAVTATVWPQGAPVTVYELSVALGVNYIELLKPDVRARRE